MKTTARQPWLGQNGNLLPDDKIKSISKSWTEEVWEEFLKSTVDVDPSESEVTLSNYESLCEEQKQSVWGTPCALPIAVQEEIHGSVKKLKVRPRKIVRLHYWEGKSVRAIGKIERLAPSRIHKIKADSLNRIKDLLENSVNTSAYLIGGSQKRKISG